MGNSKNRHNGYKGRRQGGSRTASIMLSKRRLAANSEKRADVFDTFAASDEASAFSRSKVRIAVRKWSGQEAVSADMPPAAEKVWDSAKDAGYEDFTVLESENGLIITGEHGRQPSDADSDMPLPVLGCAHSLKIPAWYMGQQVASVGEEAFAGCEELISVVIAEGVSSIEAGAFEGCTGLGAVTLPKSLKSIGSGAFRGCTSLKNIYLTSNIEKIGSGAFAGCSSLRSVEFPSGLREIGRGAFEDCVSLDELLHFETLNNLTDFGDRVFQNCSSLKYVVIPKRLSVLPAGCFCGCSSIDSIKIPDLMTEIGADAFRGCSKLRYIDLSCASSVLAKIGNSAFRGCSSLEHANLPDTVAEICDFAFAECRGLGTIILPKKDLVSLSANLFSDCTALSFIIIPDRVEEIRGGVFSGCSALGKITLPSGLKRMGCRVFCDCRSLSSIDFRQTSLEVLDNETFSECTSLSTVILPSGCLTELGQSCFRGCRSLRSFELPESVQSVGSRCFENCAGLEKLDVSAYSGCIPEGFASGCYGLKSIVFNESCPKIENSAFSGCSDLVSVELPADLESLGEQAFAKCRSLEEVSAGGKLKIIGKYAFSGCRNLECIDLPASVEQFGFNSSRPAPIFDKDPERLIIVGDPNTKAFDYAHEYRIPFFDSQINELVRNDNLAEEEPEEVSSIPPELSVAEIMNLCREVEQLSGRSAGSKVETAIVSVIDIFPGHSSVESKNGRCFIRGKYFERKANGSNTFFGVSMRGINYIGSRAFCNSFVTAVKCCDELSVIGKAAFWGCKILQDVHWPANLTSIENSAFWGCRSLKTLEFPDLLQSIKKCAFLGCSGIKKISLPKYLLEIGDYAFSYCTGLEEITVPSGTRSIGAGAFFGCSSLKRVVIPPSVRHFGPVGSDYGPIFGAGCVLADEDAVLNSDFCRNLTIVCERGSAAHEYAAQFGIKTEFTNSAETDTDVSPAIARASKTISSYIFGGLGIAEDNSGIGAESGACGIKVMDGSGRLPKVIIVDSRRRQETDRSEFFNIMKNPTGLSMSERDAMFFRLQAADDVLSIAESSGNWNGLASGVRQVLNSSRLSCTADKMKRGLGLSDNGAGCSAFRQNVSAANSVWQAAADTLGMAAKNSFEAEGPDAQPRVRLASALKASAPISPASAAPEAPASAPVSTASKSISHPKKSSEQASFLDSMFSLPSGHRSLASGLRSGASAMFGSPLGERLSASAKETMARMEKNLGIGGIFNRKSSSPSKKGGFSWSKVLSAPAAKAAPAAETAPSAAAEPASEPEASAAVESAPAAGSAQPDSAVKAAPAAETAPSAAAEPACAPELPAVAETVPAAGSAQPDSAVKAAPAAETAPSAAA